MDEEKKSGKEKAKELWEKFKAAVGKVSKLVWIIIAVVIAAIVIGLVVYFNTRSYSILVTGASTSEVTTVTTWLEGRGVRDYKVQGNTVLVPDRMATALKASLLTEMYVANDSFDWSMYFDNVGMLSTESERDNAKLFAIMERAEAVITQMEGVEWASVQITPGENRSYVLDSANVVNATATVHVRTRDGKVLSDGVAQAIRSYVAHCAQGLTLESVDLWDTNGNPYNGNGVVSTSGGDVDTSLLKLQLEQQYQNKLRSEAMQILVPLFGEDNVRCGVSVNIELETAEVTEEGPYIPDYIDEEHRGAGEGLIGTKAWDYVYKATDQSNVGGLVGTEPNSDIPTNVEQEPNSDETDGRWQGGGQKDYDNPTRTTKTYRTAGYITDCHVAVTVNSTTAKELNIELLRNTVANAVGITAVETQAMSAAEYLASKVSIYPGPFYQPPPVIVDPYAWWPFGDIIPGYYVVIGLAGLVLFLILLLILILALKSRKKKKLAAAALAAEEAEQAALAAAEDEQRQAEAALAEVMGMPQTELVGADVMSLQTEKSMELRQDIRQFVEENPEVAAQLLKTWLRGGDEHG